MWPVSECAVRPCIVCVLPWGHSLITSRLREGAGGPFSVTLCDREREGSGRCVYTHGQKIISTVLLALVIYLLGLVVYFFIFLSVE